MNSPDAQLVIPSAAYQDSFIAAVDEFIRDGYVGFWAPRALIDNFDEYLTMLREKATHPLPGYVPSTRFWLVAPRHGYVGELDLRHELNASLRRFGGHIGYDIRPSLRRRGYGKLICRLGIVEARARGIGDILITCDDDNWASRKIIEANGGVLRDKLDNGRGALTRRYWICASV